MRSVKRSLSRSLSGMICCFVLAGCGSLHESGVSGMPALTDGGSSSGEANDQRRRYQVDRDPAALRWLLGNRIDAGMPLTEVNSLLGEEGVREYDDRRFKTNGSLFRSEDEIYRWGPDNKGQSIYLGFRNKSLVNFDPAEYRE